MRVLVLVSWCLAGCNTLLGIHEITTDAGAAPDAPIDAFVMCPLPVSLGSASLTAQTAIVHPGAAGPTQTEWLGEGSDFEIEIALLSGGGTTTPDWPTILAPAADIELDTASDAFILVRADFDGSGAPRILYLSTHGTLALASAGSGVGDTVSGSLTGGVLAQVDFDRATGKILRLDTDMCQTELIGLDFSATVAPGSDGP